MSALRLLYANDVPGEHAPSWYRASVDIPERAPLEREIETDVAVIGAGYTGLSTAVHLAKAGVEAVVLDAHCVGWGASGRNGGQLGSGFNPDNETLASQLGEPRARALWRLAEEAKATVHELCAEHVIDCHYRPGIISAMHRRRFLAPLRAQVEHLESQYEYPHLQYLDAEELRALCDSPDYHGGVLDRGAGHLHPLRLALGLARVAEQHGARLFERSEVLRIVSLADSDRIRNRQVAGRTSALANGWASRGPVRLITPQGSVRAERLVLACNGYLDGFESRIAQCAMPINNFILATEPLGSRADALLPENHAVADSRFVVNYFRRSEDGRLLFGGGETYRYRFPEPDEIRRRVRRAMLQVFPQLADVAIDHVWGGTLSITRSRLPLVTELAPGQFAAAGYSGHGVALAVMTGRCIAEALMGDRTRFETLRDLPAPSFPGGRRSREPLLAAAMSFYSMLDRF